MKKMYFRRIVILRMVTTLVVAILVYNLFQIQVMDNTRWEEMATSNQHRPLPQIAPRGRIFTADGVELAGNIPSYNVGLSHLSSPEDRSAAISQLLNYLTDPALLKMDGNVFSWVGDGEYQGESQGKEGRIRVSFDVDEGVLKNLIVQHSETDEYCLQATEEVPNLMMQLNRVQHRDISSLVPEAPETTQGIVNAVKDALRENFITQTVHRHRRHHEPVIIAEDIPFELVIELEERAYQIPGLAIINMPRRVYPNGTILAHSLGRTTAGFGNTIVGNEGLELQWDEYLTGQNGRILVPVNASNRPVGDPWIEDAAIPGHDLHLTIDAGLQQVAQEALYNQLKVLRENHGREGAWAGAVVVMDPNTGKILAMVTEPNFDNNHKYNTLWDEDMPDRDPQGNPLKTYFSRAYQWRRPPGSTFKMLTGLAALETGHVTPTERINDTGRATIAGRSIPNYGGRAYGRIDMIRAMEVSSNIYFGVLGNRMGRETLYEYIDIFGMTGIPHPHQLRLAARRNEVTSAELRSILIEELEKEGRSVLLNAGFSDIAASEQMYGMDRYQSEMIEARPYWPPANTVQAAYGQLNEFTPLQMANYVSMLANGGVHYRPFMVEKITNSNGEVVEAFTPEIIREAGFNPDNLRVMQQSMHQAASGGVFRDLPFKIAGKTGTAQDVGDDVEHSWWVGYAPFEKPEIAIVILQEHGSLGARSTPIARAIIDHYFGLHEEVEEDE